LPVHFISLETSESGFKVVDLHEICGMFTSIANECFGTVLNAFTFIWTLYVHPQYFLDVYLDNGMYILLDD